MADKNGLDLLKKQYTGNTPDMIAKGASNTANIGNTQIGDMQHNIMWSPQWIQDKWKNAGRNWDEPEKIKNPKLDPKSSEYDPNAKDEPDMIENPNAYNKGKQFGDRAGMIAAVLGNALASTPIHWGGMASGGNPENDLIRKGIEQSNEDFRKVGQEAAEGGMNAMQASNEQARQNAEMINTADLMKQIGSLSEDEKAAIVSGKSLAGNGSIQTQLISDMFKKFMDWMDEKENKNNDNALEESVIASSEDVSPNDSSPVANTTVSDTTPKSGKLPQVDASVVNTASKGGKIPKEELSQEDKLAAIDKYKAEAKALQNRSKSNLTKVAKKYGLSYNDIKGVLLDE